jgi:deoxycytidine triphosphate deaminase
MTEQKGPLTQNEAPADEAVAGAILGDAAVERRIRQGQLLKFRAGENVDAALAANLKRGRYHLRLSDRQLIVPVDKSVEKSGFRRYTETDPMPDGHELILKPGDAALISTMEHFRMPNDVSGSLGLRFRQARKGLLTLNGPFADPGFGWPDGEPLYMLLANMNTRTVSLRPGDQLISVQFVKIAEVGPIDPIRVGTDINREWFHETAREGPQLAFFGQLRDTSEQVKDLTKRADKVEDSIDRYSVMGVFLIAAALILAFVTGLAGILKDLEIDEVNRELPDGIWFFGIAVTALLLGFIFWLPYKAFRLIRPGFPRRSRLRFQPWRWDKAVRNVLVLVRTDECTTAEDVSIAAFGTAKRHERVTKVACSEPRFRDRVKDGATEHAVPYDVLAERMRVPDAVSRLPRTAATPQAPP